MLKKLALLLAAATAAGAADADRRTLKENRDVYQQVVVLFLDRYLLGGD